MVRSESLLPREHGVYAELAFPLLTGLLLADINLASVGFAITIVIGVLIHEPFAIVTGRRGKRLQEAHGDRARRRVIVLGVLMAGAAGAAVLSSPPAATLWALVPVAFASLLAPVVLFGRAKTFLGEVLVVAVLTTALLPVATAGHVAWTTAVAASAVWCVSFTMGTITVHGVKRHHKRRPDGAWILAASPVLGVTAVAGGLTGMWMASFTPAIVGALVPPVLAASAIGIARVHPKNLRVVGWSLVAANLVTMCVLLLWLDPVLPPAGR